MSRVEVGGWWTHRLLPVERCVRKGAKRSDAAVARREAHVLIAPRGRVHVHGELVAGAVLRAEVRAGVAPHRDVERAVAAEDAGLGAAPGVRVTVPDRRVGRDDAHPAALGVGAGDGAVRGGRLGAHIADADAVAHGRRVAVLAAVAFDVEDDRAAAGVAVRERPTVEHQI